MKIEEVKQGSNQWLDFRRAKISGTSLGDIWSANQYTKDDMTKLFEASGVEFKKSARKSDLELLLTDEMKAILASNADRKIGYYQLLADYLAEPADTEERMDRGLRLEQMASDKFTAKTGKQLEIVGVCVSDVDNRIINSPDRLVVPSKAGIYREAVEIKNLSSSRHLQAMLEDKVPDEYFTQKVQYFVVNEKLERCFWVFHDDRFKYPHLQLHVIEVTRESLGDWPDIMLRFQVNQLKEIDATLERLAF